MLLRRHLAQLDPDTVLHGGVVQVDLKPVPHDDGTARESQDVLHGASHGRVVRTLARRGVKAAFGRWWHAPRCGRRGRPVRTGSQVRTGPVGASSRHARMARGVPTGTGARGLTGPWPVSFWPSCAGA